MRIKPEIIIKTLRNNDFDVTKTSLDLGVHRSTIYRWLKRSRTAYGYVKYRGLKYKSTRPHQIHYLITPDQEVEILDLRNRKGYTASKVKAILNLEISSKTIHRFLKRKGLVKSTGFYRRPKLQETLHMHAKNTKTIGYLQMDVKYITPELSGLPWTCYEYAVIDIFSRYKEAVILNQLDQDGAICALLEILPKLPFKAVFLQNDNGLEFQKRFHDFVISLGLKHHYLHKQNPNENAIIERSFRTDEEEFFYRLERAPVHYDELRTWFAEYLKEYNHERPHLGINLKTPYEIVADVVSH